MTRELTNNQVARLQSCIKRGTTIPKDIRRKLYYIMHVASNNLNKGYYNALDNILHQYFGISLNCIDILELFPKKEFSKEKYVNFYINKAQYDDYYWDSLDDQGMIRRREFLKYLLYNFD